MTKTMTSLMLVGALAFNLAACGTAATTATLPNKAEEQASCRETGLTNAGDAKMGQLDCSPRQAPGAASTK